MNLNSAVKENKLYPSNKLDSLICQSKRFLLSDKKDDDKHAWNWPSILSWSFRHCLQMTKMEHHLFKQNKEKKNKTAEKKAMVSLCFSFMCSTMVKASWYLLFDLLNLFMSTFCNWFRTTSKLADINKPAFVFTPKHVLYRAISRHAFKRWKQSATASCNNRKFRQQSKPPLKREGKKENAAN